MNGVEAVLQSLNVQCQRWSICIGNHVHKVLKSLECAATFGPAYMVTIYSLA